MSHMTKETCIMVFKYVCFHCPHTTTTTFYKPCTWETSSKSFWAWLLNAFGLVFESIILHYISDLLFFKCRISVCKPVMMEHEFLHTLATRTELSHKKSEHMWPRSQMSTSRDSCGWFPLTGLHDVPLSAHTRVTHTSSPSTCAYMRERHLQSVCLWLTINRIQNKIVCNVYNYFVYINTHTCMYIFNEYLPLYTLYIIYMI